jgi:hypothetical protein
MRNNKGALGGEAGSLLATSDEATMGRIIAGMVEADEDLRLMEAWKRNGFVSGFSTLSVLYGGRDSSKDAYASGGDEERPTSDFGRRLREGYALLNGAS